MIRSIFKSFDHHSSMIAAAAAAALGVLFLWSAASRAQTVEPGKMMGTLAAGASVTTGLAPNPQPGHPTTSCSNPTAKFPAAGMPPRAGVVTSSDGKSWTVPIAVQDGPFAVDMYNDCTGQGDNPNWASQLQTVVIDKDGVEITGFIHADNYFELWVNGRFIARDSIAMVPFNTSVVRFRARYPITYAIRGIDWETHQGVGLEYPTFNIGDGGFIAYFSDGTRTGADWKAETFYVAPLDDPSCVRVLPTGARDSTFCAQAVRPTCATKDPNTCSALHFGVPPDWTAPRFDDSRWPNAVEWPAALVTDHISYTKNVKVFEDAAFIWTRNLRLDNEVLARYTAKGPRRR
jgi:hypothetical protein